MVEQDVRIVNRLGLHARAAAKLVHLANVYQADIWLLRDGEEVDAKSILGIHLLAAAQGTDLRIRCSGRDESEALEAMVALISNSFDEESMAR